MEHVIRRYYDGCNEADREKMLECLNVNAVHYFPTGAVQGPFVGAEAIADGWVAAVRRLDSRWTIDRMLLDEVTGEAAVEWTHFKPAQAKHLRGDEWFRFDEEGRILEIRAYYAAPPDVDADGLAGFDYAGRGYATAPPELPGRPLPALRNGPA